MSLWWWSDVAGQYCGDVIVAPLEILYLKCTFTICDGGFVAAAGIRRRRAGIDSRIHEWLPALVDNSSSDLTGARYLWFGYALLRLCCRHRRQTQHEHQHDPNGYQLKDPIASQLAAS